jgi:hypothetical protein
MRIKRRHVDAGPPTLDEELDWVIGSEAVLIERYGSIGAARARYRTCIAEGWIGPDERHLACLDEDV